MKSKQFAIHYEISFFFFRQEAFPCISSFLEILFRLKRKTWFACSNMTNATRICISLARIRVTQSEICARFNATRREQQIGSRSRAEGIEWEHVSHIQSVDKTCPTEESRRLWLPTGSFRHDRICFDNALRHTVRGFTCATRCATLCIREDARERANPSSARMQKTLSLDVAYYFNTIERCLEEFKTRSFDKF